METRGSSTISKKNYIAESFRSRKNQFRLYFSQVKCYLFIQSRQMLKNVFDDHGRWELLSMNRNILNYVFKRNSQDIKGTNS